MKNLQLLNQMENLRKDSVTRMSNKLIRHAKVNKKETLKCIEEMANDSLVQDSLEEVFDAMISTMNMNLKVFYVMSLLDKMNRPDLAWLLLLCSDIEKQQRRKGIKDLRLFILNLILDYENTSMTKEEAEINVNKIVKYDFGFTHTHEFTQRLVESGLLKDNSVEALNCFSEEDISYLVENNKVDEVSLSYYNYYKEENNIAL